MKNFSFPLNLWGLISSPVAQRIPAKPAPEQGERLVLDFLRILSEGQSEAVKALLSPEFRAHEPAENKISTADELLFDWERTRSQYVHQRFDVRHSAVFSVFGDIDRDKYVYVQADCLRLKSNNRLLKSTPFELIARLEGNRISHALFCFGRSRAFDSLSSVQHARSLTVK
ncbi:hypothetical protein [Arundinibacter roseus]|uniref:Nuclear transport factor 2 family protein n=1 Tax=Arundinibacter roseus TaxID=2070510 RepID=A0A4R4KKY0_9BACT|nr:hypothetical protein [Arundinibacter roseus]TDB68967.1 hypothetical protein EZE20_01105 [Arundinibacter roseus]